jgi:hypothetical protein
MRIEGSLWYSEKQKQAARDVAWSDYGLPLGCAPLPYEPALGKLEDGRLVRYTEVLPPGERSLWDDAVYLGEGEYAGE